MGSPLENLAGPGKALSVEPRDEMKLAGLQRSGLVQKFGGPDLARLAP